MVAPLRAEAWLAEREIPKAQLMVRRDNKAAVGFYRLGYTEEAVCVVSRRLD